VFASFALEFDTLIQITRLLAKQLVSVMKKALNRSKPTPVLTVRSGDDGLSSKPRHRVMQFVTTIRVRKIAT
jgi:hypothetical protein